MINQAALDKVLEKRTSIASKYYLELSKEELTVEEVVLVALLIASEGARESMGEEFSGNLYDALTRTLSAETLKAM
tara:strand:- start:1434 stop:1661 length:228 start_codon:yes stop_codon:yes gene_type:complete